MDFVNAMRANGLLHYHTSDFYGSTIFYQKRLLSELGAARIARNRTNPLRSFIGGIVTFHDDRRAVYIVQGQHIISGSNHPFLITMLGEIYSCSAQDPNDLQSYSYSVVACEYERQRRISVDDHHFDHIDDIIRDAPRERLQLVLLARSQSLRDCIRFIRNNLPDEYKTNGAVRSFFDRCIQEASLVRLGPYHDYIYENMKLLYRTLITRELRVEDTDVHNSPFFDDIVEVYYQN